MSGRAGCGSARNSRHRDDVAEALEWRGRTFERAPGQGLKGIRLTLAGMPFSSRTSSRASAGESLTSFSMTYSKVMRRALVRPG